MFSRTVPFSRRAEKASSHQKLVRAARRVINPHLPADIAFPTAAKIIHFEGKNGPDGLLDKRSVTDEPIDHINLKDPSDRTLFNQVENHIYNLHDALKKKNTVRAEFEAAWLEHLVVDGLTPAHHQPSKERPETDTHVEEHKTNIGAAADVLKLYWKYLGPSGGGIHHLMFEAGVEAIVMPLSPQSLAKIKIPAEDLEKVKSGQFIKLYEASVRKIDSYKMFQRYEKSSWTTELAHDVREVLIPEAVRMVSLAWLAAVYRKKQ